MVNFVNDQKIDNEMTERQSSSFGLRRGRVGWLAQAGMIVLSWGRGAGAAVCPVHKRVIRVIAGLHLPGSRLAL